MRLECRLLIILLTLLLASETPAQYYDAGHEPGSTRWRIITTSRFDVIYPDTLEQKAQQFAAYLDSLLPLMQQEFMQPARKIPILLHNRMTISNAFVGWAPSRMELYTIPPSDGYAHDWLEQLAIHESTHWMQFSQMYQGTTGILARVFGEHIAAGVMGVYIPFWAIEGDAVFYETALSSAGRGRDAEFERLLRSRQLQKKPYSYNKAYLGSYKDRVADHYTLGYQLSAFGRAQYGDHLWDSVYREVARNPYNPLAFYTALKKHTGKGKARLYREAMATLSKEWRQKDANSLYDSLIHRIRTPEAWVEYHQPTPYMLGEYIAERTSLHEINAIVKVTARGDEKVLLFPGYTMGAGFSRCDHKIYYTAWSRHKRWPNIQYSDIWVYDFFYDTIAQLTSHGQFFSPVEDPISGELYALRYHPNHRISLVRMDSGAEVIAEYLLPDGTAASHPSWWTDQDCLLFVATGRNGKAFFTWDGANPPIRISPWTYTNIDFPYGHGNSILFHAGFDGVNQIYLYNADDQTLTQVTHARFGAMYPSTDSNGDLLFSEALEKGMAISTLPQDAWGAQPRTWIERPEGFHSADKMGARNTSLPPMAELCDSCYTSARYHPMKHLLRIHSWAPADIDPDATDIQPGISIFSQNTLSTAFFKAGFRYDRYSLLREYYASMTYKGYWPEISVGYAFSDVLFFDDDPSTDNFRYGRHGMGLKLNIPLYSTKQQWNKYFDAEAGISYLGFTHFEQTNPDFIHGGMYYTHGSLYAHKLRRMAVKDLHPRWGQIIRITAIATSGGSIDAGDVIGASLTTYWPGILKHHSLKLYLGAQKRDHGKDLLFNRLINTPRGYQDLSVDTAYAAQITYKFPLLYPDLSIGPLAYVKRISVAGFFDAVTDRHQRLNPKHYSYGFELYADLHILRHFAPVTIGYLHAIRSDRTTWHHFMFQIAFSI